MFDGSMVGYDAREDLGLAGVYMPRWPQSLVGSPTSYFPAFLTPAF